MKPTIISQKINPLFGREEVEFVVHADKTPSEKEIEALVAENFSGNVENVKVRIIKGRFGCRDFVVKADIYKNNEDKIRFGMIKKRNKKKKAVHAKGKK